MSDSAQTVPSVRVLGTRVDGYSYDTATIEIIRRAKRKRKGGYVCAVNVHMVMEAVDDPGFKETVNGSVMSVPDGMPIVWAMKLLGISAQRRVYGPTLMTRCLEAAAREGIPVGLFGGRPEVLSSLTENLGKKYPTLRVSYAYSPPFRTLTTDETSNVIQNIRDASPEILFVGLGCPKQERWMARHASSLNTVMIGVGAAFDFHAGSLPMAPSILQHVGLEWAFRLGVEPRRLFLRYAKHNPRFITRFLLQLLNIHRRGRMEKKGSPPKKGG